MIEVPEPKGDRKVYQDGPNAVYYEAWAKHRDDVHWIGCIDAANESEALEVAQRRAEKMGFTNPWIIEPELFTGPVFTNSDLD